MSTVRHRASAGQPKPHEEGRRILSLLNARAGGDEPLPVEKESGGRPFFSDGRADFNISHSRNMTAAAWVPSGRIGCDVQYLDPSKSYVQISRRFFHSEEQSCVEQAGEEGIRSFYRIWVLKEAWLKLHGLSVFDMAKAPLFSIGRGKGDFESFLYELESPAGEKYMLALVRDHLCETEPEFLWFSERVLTIRDCL